MFLKRLQEVVPVLIYFFIMFVLLSYTESLLLERHDTLLAISMTALVGALMVALAVLFLDMFSFMEPFPKVPVIYNALWKTLLYVQVVFALELLRSHLPSFLHHEISVPIYDRMMSGRFFILHVWLVILMAAYWVFRGLKDALGPGKVNKLIWGSGSNGE